MDILVALEQSPELDATVTPQLFSYLQAAAINQLPMYAERIATHLYGADVAAFRDIVENRLGVAMSASKRQRLEAVLKRLPESDQKRR